MKILVEGKLDQLKEVKFECDRCGCIFVANEMEYRIEAEFPGCYALMCECPCCGMNVLINEAIIMRPKGNR